jgi:hypothetical protein
MLIQEVHLPGIGAIVQLQGLIVQEVVPILEAQIRIEVIHLEVVIPRQEEQLV